MSSPTTFSAPGGTLGFGGRVGNREAGERESSRWRRLRVSPVGRRIVPRLPGPACPFTRSLAELSGMLGQATVTRVQRVPCGESVGQAVASTPVTRPSGRVVGVAVGVGTGTDGEADGPPEQPRASKLRATSTPASLFERVLSSSCRRKRSGYDKTRP